MNVCTLDGTVRHEPLVVRLAAHSLCAIVAALPCRLPSRSHGLCSYGAYYLWTFGTLHVCAPCSHRINDRVVCATGYSSCGDRPNSRSQQQPSAIMDRLLFLHLIVVIACCIQAHEHSDSPFDQHTEGLPSIVVGWNRCACQPQEYELTLDFSLTCADSTVEQNAGVEAFACDIVSRDDGNDGSLIPAAVDVIQILELDSQRQVQSQIVFEEWKAPFREGDRLWFASITGKARRLASDAIPTGMQIIIDARTAQGTPLIATFFLQFKSGCNSDSYPALRAGDTAGWVQFVRTHLGISSVWDLTLYTISAEDSTNP